MLRFIALLLSCLLIAAPALADLPLPEMATEDLIALRDAISLELAARSASADALAVWESEKLRLELTGIIKGTSSNGTPAVAVRFNYTNKLTTASNFRKSHWVRMYHDGVECDESIYFLDRLAGASDTWSTNVLPGRTYTDLLWVFELRGSEDYVVFEIVDYDSQDRSIGFQTVKLPDNAISMP